MQGGAKFLACSALLAIAACGGEQGKLTIRSAGAPLSAQAKPVSMRVAEGQVQLALGNVALALESFRKAVREDPRSIEARTGIAASYDRMARYDLSRKHYEAALAVEPANEHVLAALAASLDLQGKRSEAAAVRGEIRQRLAVVAAGPDAASFENAGTIPNPAMLDGPALSSTALTVDREAISPSVAVTSIIDLPAAPPVRTPESRAPMTVTSADMPTAIAAAAPARSVTITLPPPRPAAAKSAPVAVAAPAAAAVPINPAQAATPAAKPEPAPQRAEPVPATAVAAKPERGPRLERTSMAEVTLLTRRAEPMWTPRLVQRTARSSTIRFVPLRQAQAHMPIRVLNAARVDRLAANTRLLMSRRGWKNVVIGNAPAVRSRSLILYPANARPAAQRLAAQLGFATALRVRNREVTILLGHDATALIRKRATA